MTTKREHVTKTINTVTDFASIALQEASQKVNDEAISLAFSMGYNAALGDNDLPLVGVISKNG